MHMHYLLLQELQLVVLLLQLVVLLKHMLKHRRHSLHIIWSLLLVRWAGMIWMTVWLLRSLWLSLLLISPSKIGICVTPHDPLYDLLYGLSVQCGHVTGPPMKWIIDRDNQSGPCKLRTTPSHPRSIYQYYAMKQYYEQETWTMLSRTIWEKIL